MTKWKLIPIEDVKIGDKVMTVDGPKEVEFVHTPSSDTQDEVQGEFYRITIDNGAQTEVSDIHRFMTPDGDWKGVMDLSIGDELKIVLPDGETTSKIKEIQSIGINDKYDLTVKDNQQYVTEHGFVNHNTGTIYSADSIFIIGKSQSKVKEEIAGYNFTLRAEKSRFVKEKSKFPITVHYDKGILPYSGFLDIAKGLGYVSTCRVGVKGGWKFVLEDCKQFGLEPNEGEAFVFKTLTNDVDSDKEFWKNVMKYTDLKEQISALYKIPSSCSDDELALVDAMPDELKELIAND